MEGEAYTSGMTSERSASVHVAVTDSGQSVLAWPLANQRLQRPRPAAEGARRACVCRYRRLRSVSKKAGGNQAGTLRRATKETCPHRLNAKLAPRGTGHSHWVTNGTQLEENLLLAVPNKNCVSNEYKRNPIDRP